MNDTIQKLGKTVQLSNAQLTRIDTDDSHFYFIDSKELNLRNAFCVSLTHVLDIAAPFPVGLRNWLRSTEAEESNGRMEMTRDRGIKLHDALDRLMNAVELDLEKDYRTVYEKDAITTFTRFMRFLAPAAHRTEMTVVDPKIRIAGTLDFSGIVDARRLTMLLEPNKYLEIDEKDTYKPKPQFVDMLDGDPELVKIVIDWKFTGRTAYNHLIQVAGYSEMYGMSYTNERPVTRKFTWRYSPMHKHHFDFQESFLEYSSFLRTYDTFMEYTRVTSPKALDEDGFMKPPDIRVYPERVRLFDKLPDKEVA